MKKRESTLSRLEHLTGVAVDLKRELSEIKSDKPAKQTADAVKKSAKSKENSASAKSEKSDSSRKDKPEVKSAKSQKKEPQKTTKKKSVKQEEQRKPCTTEQVMKLVERSADVNPVLLAGKSRVPSTLRGKESLTKILRRDLGEEFDDSENTVVVNITEVAIEYEAPVILDRFNACSCDKCVEIFSKIISQRVPVRFARVNKNGRGVGNRELSERVAPMRKMVLTEMIKELIGSKKRCYHDDTE